MSRYEEEKEDELIVLNHEEQNLQAFDEFPADEGAQSISNKGRVRIIQN